MLNTAPGHEGKSGYLFNLFNTKVYCVFSLESPHRGDSNESTQYTISNIKKEITLNYPKSAFMGFYPGTRTSSKQPW